MLWLSRQLVKVLGQFCCTTERSETDSRNMNLNRELPWDSALGGLILVLITFAFAPKSNANVYATNIRINEGATNVVASSGDTLTITYILNEPASLGATLQMQSGATVVQTLELPAAFGAWPPMTRVH